MLLSASSKIFIFITGFFFLCGSLEVDISCYDNTFFDSYDTYIHTDSDVGSIVADQSHAVPIVLDFKELISALNFSAIQEAQPELDRAGTYTDQHLFLTYSVWRI